MVVLYRREILLNTLSGDTGVGMCTDNPAGRGSKGDRGATHKSEGGYPLAHAIHPGHYDGDKTPTRTSTTIIMIIKNNNIMDIILYDRVRTRAYNRRRYIPDGHVLSRARFGPAPVLQRV